MKSHVNIVINLLNDPGFDINFEKSFIKSFHNQVHLSYIWDSSDMSISVPSDKIIKTRNFAYYLIHDKCSQMNKLFFPVC